MFGTFRKGASMCGDIKCLRGFRYDVQASCRHQAHCLRRSEFGRLAANKRMHGVETQYYLMYRTYEALPVIPQTNFNIRYP